MILQKTGRKALSMVLVLAMVLSMVPGFSAFAADGFSDTEGHWAEAAINTWSGYGVLNGYEDGTFAPNGNITRGELAKVLNGIIGYQRAAANNFGDVPADAWFADAVLKLAEAGVMQGSGGMARPNDAITREEAAVLIARAFAVDENSGNENAFADAGDIASWAYNLVNGMKAAGYVQGAENRFNPKSSITRAEVVTILNNMIAEYHNIAGTVGGETVENVTGNVVVSAAGITLKNKNITGNLYLMNGIADGDVTVQNVTVSGKVFVWGGGSDSIHFINCKIAELVVNGDGVRVTYENGTVELISAIDGVVELGDGVVVDSLVVNSDSTVAVKSGVTVKLAEIAGGTLNVEKGGTVNKAVVTASGSKLANEGTVTRLEVEAAVTVTGSVAVKEAVIKANGSNFAKAPEKYEVAAGYAAIIEGKEVQSSTGGTGGTGGTGLGFTGGGNTTKAVSTQAEFDAAVANTAIKTINITGGDITISAALARTGLTVNVASGATLRDYWKVGNGNKVIANAGANLRWGAGTDENLLVGAADSSANIALAARATFTIVGAASDAISEFILNGNAVVQAQGATENPFLINANTKFTVNGNLTAKSVASTGSAISLVGDGSVLSISNSGSLTLEAESRVVVGNSAVITPASRVDDTANTAIDGKGIIDSLWLKIAPADDKYTGATVVEVDSQTAFDTAAANVLIQTINVASGNDITIGTALVGTGRTVAVASGATLRDYWMVGNGNKVVAAAGANLRWGTGTTANLLVGAADSTANIELATGATFTVVGAAGDEISEFILNGNAVIQAQGTSENPFLINEDTVFTVNGTLTAKAVAGTGSAISLVGAGSVLKLAAGSSLVVEANSRIVVGNGAVITPASLVTNTANAAIDGKGIVNSLWLDITPADDKYTGATLVTVATQGEFDTAAANAVVQNINITSGNITIDTTLAGTGRTVTVASGATLRDYWLVGNGNKVVAAEGAELRWGAGNTDNLLVGAAGSTANIALATGATFTIVGAASDEISEFILNGNAAVQAQGTSENPFLINEDTVFTVNGTLTAKAVAGTGSAISLVGAGSVLKLAAGSSLVVEANSRIVVGKDAVITLASLVDDAANEDIDGKGIVDSLWLNITPADDKYTGTNDPTP